MKVMKRLTAVVLSLILCASAFYPAYSADEVLDVPQIRITTKNGNGTSLKKSDGYIDASISITDTDNTTVSDSVVVKVRGNSTAFDSIGKKSYTFKFNKKKNLFSMGSGKKWALVSNVYDPTLARNYVAFSLAQKLGIQYTSNFKVAEVWMDGSFRGCYMLFEPVAEGKDRVDIDIEGNDGKKDFLLELESLRTEDDVTYITSNGIRFAISEPDPPEDDQVSYIKSTVDDIIDTLKSGTKEEIETKIDLESFSKYYILNEFLKTVDFNFSSVFYYYKDGKLYAGPPWDYDLSSGNVNKDFSANYASSYKTDGLFINDKNLYKFLCRYDWFNDLSKEVFIENYPYFMSIYSDGGVIDTFYKTYENAIKRNFSGEGWNVAFYYVNAMKYPLKTYEENYDFYVNWCKERVEWLTEYYDVDPSTVPSTEAPTSEETTAAEVSTSEETTAAAETTTQLITTEEPSTAVYTTEIPTTEALTTEPAETTAEPTETGAVSPTTSAPSTTAPKTEPTASSSVTEPIESTAEPLETTQPVETTPAVPAVKEPTEPAVMPLLCGNIYLKAGTTSELPAYNPFFNKARVINSGKNAVTLNNDKITALKKGAAEIKVTFGKTELIYKVNVIDNPKLNKKSVVIKKGKTISVKIIGKARSVNNKYKNTKYAKIISKKSAKKIKVRGLKKGKTTLKVFVNGYELKLKVKVK